MCARAGASTLPNILGAALVVALGGCALTPTSRGACAEPFCCVDDRLLHLKTSPLPSTPPGTPNSQVQVHCQAGMLRLPGPRSQRRGPHLQHPAAVWLPGIVGGQGGCVLRAAVCPPSASRSLQPLMPPTHQTPLLYPLPLPAVPGLHHAARCFCAAPAGQPPCRAPGAHGCRCSQHERQCGRQQ